MTTFSIRLFPVCHLRIGTRRRPIQTLRKQKHGAKAIVVDYHVWGRGRHARSLPQAINDRETSYHIAENLERTSSEASGKGCSELSQAFAGVREQG